MSPGCGWCKHFCQKSWLVTTDQLNVSGKPSKLRKWSKHRCALKQEDRYPKTCDFEEDVEYRAELRRKFPDLARMEDRINASAKRVNKLIKEWKKV